MKASWRSPWAAPALAIAWLVATAWARPLTLPDEGRYVGVAWGMLASGDWLVPHLNGLPYFHKPPLFYWITAASLATFGPSEWAARAAPLLGAGAGVLALFQFARRWFGAREAKLALLALATQPLFFLGGQFANLDMLVAGSIAVTILAFAHAALMEESGARSRPALAAGYLFAACGVLAKGLIGIVLPGLVLVAWLLLRRQPRVLLRLVWWPGLVLFLAVAAPWFVAMQQRFPEFAHYFFVVQHFARYSQAGFNNPQPAWFFVVVLALLALPWSAWMLAGARRQQWQQGGRGALRLLLWLWLVAILVFFSLPRSKLVGYILPASWPLALLAADAFAHAASARAARLWRASAAAAVATCLLTVAVAATRDLPSTRLLAGALRAQAAPGDTVVVLHGAYFDLPFYARLRQPVLVVDQWDDPNLMARDNWRKELADAGRFAPGAAQRLLLTPAQLPQVACTGATVWLVGSRSMPARFPLLRKAEEVARQRDVVLWRLRPPAPALRRAVCPETPSVSSADKS